MATDDEKDSYDGDVCFTTELPVLRAIIHHHRTKKYAHVLEGLVPTARILARMSERYRVDIVCAALSHTYLADPVHFISIVGHTDIFGMSAEATYNVLCGLVAEGVTVSGKEYTVRHSDQYFFFTPVETGGAV